MRSKGQQFLLLFSLHVFENDHLNRTITNYKRRVGMHHLQHVVGCKQQEWKNNACCERQSSASSSHCASKMHQKDNSAEPKNRYDASHSVIQQLHVSDVPSTTIRCIIKRGADAAVFVRLYNASQKRSVSIPRIVKLPLGSTSAQVRALVDADAPSNGWWSFVSRAIVNIQASTFAGWVRL